MAGLLASVIGCTSEANREDPWADAQEGSAFKNGGERGQVTPIRVGKTVTDSLDSLWLTTQEPARILDVRSNGGEPTLRHIGVMLADDQRRSLQQYQYANFPPSEKRLGAPPRALDEVLVPPVAETRNGRGFRLLIGYEFAADDFAYRTSFDLLYEIDGTVYRQRMNSVLVACPKSMDDGVCAKRAQEEMDS